MKAKKNVTNDLGKDPVGSLLFKLALPAIMAQVVNALYSIVDRIYIGRIEGVGALALTGVGLTFPIIMLISAFSALVGMGGAPRAAIKMGEKDHEGAERILANSFSTLLILSAILTTVFMVFKEPLLYAFGASDNTISFAVDYLGIYLLGTVFVQLALGLNPFINTQGFAKVGMQTVLIGAVINIVLDPILIFGFDLGVKGAALATIISQAVSAAWVLYFLFGKKSILKIRKSNLKIERKVILPVLALGIAPFTMQATESLVSITLNKSLFVYGGDMAVGAMTIISSLMQILLMPLMGLTQGAQPIISFNYGAGQLDRVKKAFKLLLISCLIFSCTMWAALLAFPQVFVGLFNKDPELVGITVWGMRIFFAGIFLFGAQMACQQTFLALGQAKISLFLALLRKIILLIPLVLILPKFMELQGIFVAEPVADILAALTTIGCFTVFYRKTLVEPTKQ